MRNKKKIIRTCTVPLSLDFFEEISEKMVADGYEVVVVTSPGAELDAFKLRASGKLRDESLEHSGELRAESLELRDSLELREGLKAIRCIEVPMERHISLWKDGVALLRMIWVLMKERPYMVHSMTPKAGLLTMVAGWLTGVPVRIHTFTGLVWPTSVGMKRKVLMAMDRLLCGCATHIIPEGEGVMNDLRNGGITKKQMKVLGYGNVKGVDMVRLDPMRFVDFDKNSKNPEEELDSAVALASNARESGNSSDTSTNSVHRLDSSSSQSSSATIGLSNSPSVKNNKNNSSDNKNCGETPITGPGPSVEKSVEILGQNPDQNPTENLTENDREDILGGRRVAPQNLNENPNENLSLRSAERVFTFLFVGRIVGDKGINELVESFTRLHDKYSDTKLRMVGWIEKELDPVSELTQQRIDANDAIEVPGPMFGDELLKEYVVADCHVMPSYREGFPNTVLEAGAMGLPQIVTDINGSREIIVSGFKTKTGKTPQQKMSPMGLGANACQSESSCEHGTSDCQPSSPVLCQDSSSTEVKNIASLKNHLEPSETLKPSETKMKICDNGIIVPSKDVDALYDAMERMLVDRVMYETMARNARPMIESRFEKGFVRRCLLEFYEGILA